MKWTCQQFEERLTDFLDDALSVADRAAFVAHQQECAQCHALVERVSNMVLAIHHVEPIEPPQGLIYRILEASGPRRERGWFGLAWLTPRFAMSGLTVALFLLMIYPFTGIDVTKLEWNDLTPANMYRAADRRATLMYARGVKFVNGLRVLHEIQSRLQPADSEAVPVKEELKKKDDDRTQSEKDQQENREQNRAFEPRHIPITLAGLFPSVSGGMNP